MTDVEKIESVEEKLDKIVNLFKPLLASPIDDVNLLKFPVLCSTKLDGIRASVQGGRLLSRTLKPIPNKHVQARFAGLPKGLDGELIYGDPKAKDAYRNTVSIVMSDDKPANGIRYHVFDKFGEDEFQIRLKEIEDVKHKYIMHVKHKLIHDAEELLDFEANLIELGHEGVMVRSLKGRYKQGRSSVNEGILLKLKRFVDAEGIVLDTFEEEHNANTAMTNELGHTYRSTAQANLIGKGVLGGLILKGLGGDFNEIEFRCGTGFDKLSREALWKIRETLIGKIAKVKYFPVGSKDKPRHPVWLGWRDPMDM